MCEFFIIIIIIFPSLPFVTFSCSAHSSLQRAELNTRGRRLLSLPLPGQDSNSSSSSDGDQFDDGVTSDLEMETSAPGITFRGVTPHCINGVKKKKHLALAAHWCNLGCNTAAYICIFFSLKKKNICCVVVLIQVQDLNRMAGSQSSKCFTINIYACQRLTVKSLPSFSGLAV